MIQPIFITGIGTDVGKTVVAAIITEALQAAYWKPVQAGFDQGTDSQWVGSMISHSQHNILPEAYKLSLPASPHIAAREEGVVISLDKITRQLRDWQDAQQSDGFLVIEGAGGLLVPLNDKEFILDLAQALNAPLILVSRNYLGSINHSLLTATVCKTRGLPVAGWIFNDQYGHYETEIVQWSGIPTIASIPLQERPDKAFIHAQAARIRQPLLDTLDKTRQLPGT
jgi:dethiobiotin synthetase